MEHNEEARPGFMEGTNALYESSRKGYAAYKSVDLFIKNELLSKGGEEQHKRDFWFKTAKSVTSGQVGCYAPIIAGLGAAIQSFVGGANHASEWEPLNFKGQFQFDTQGVLQTTRDLWCHNFYLNPGSREDLGAQRPLQEIGWGIFNFTSGPLDQETEVPYNRNHWQGSDVTRRLTEQPHLVVNPDCGMDLKSVRVAFVNTGRNPPDRAISRFMTVPEAMERGTTYDRWWGTIRSCGTIWELKFKTTLPTRFSDSEVLVVKKLGGVQDFEMTGGWPPSP